METTLCFTVNKTLRIFPSTENHLMRSINDRQISVNISVPLYTIH
jgi:hypothetical protein